MQAAESIRELVGNWIRRPILFKAGPWATEPNLAAPHLARAAAGQDLTPGELVVFTHGRVELWQDDNNEPPIGIALNNVRAGEVATVELNNLQFAEVQYRLAADPGVPRFNQGFINNPEVAIEQITVPVINERNPRPGHYPHSRVEELPDGSHIHHLREGQPIRHLRNDPNESEMELAAFEAQVGRIEEGGMAQDNIRAVRAVLEANVRAANNTEFPRTIYGDDAPVPGAAQVIEANGWHHIRGNPNRRALINNDFEHLRHNANEAWANPNPTQMQRRMAALREQTIAQGTAVNAVRIEGGVRGPRAQFPQELIDRAIIPGIVVRAPANANEQTIREAGEAIRNAINDDRPAVVMTEGIAAQVQENLPNNDMADAMLHAMTGFATAVPNNQRPPFPWVTGKDYEAEPDKQVQKWADQGLKRFLKREKRRIKFKDLKERYDPVAILSRFFRERRNKNDKSKPEAQIWQQ